MDATMIGQRLKNLRGERTLKTVAESVGITTQAICNYEAGIRVPRDEVKKNLADYYGVPVGDLFFADDVHETQTRP